VSDLLHQIAHSGGDAAAGERVAKELDTLRARFDEAAAHLKNNKIEDMPWYVMIGAPGSGKTTALLNSGLRFPLMAKDGTTQVSGVGGTRNCDWWFTDEAVLLDTAGRYTTQDSNARADAAAWHGFLALLKQARPSLPLNGALVSVSAADLMLWTKPERTKFAAHVRMRLSEIYAALGMRLPIYMLVTKTDLIAGFTEFFGDLDSEERAQVWGTTFAGEIDPSFMGAPYAKEFAALEERLGAEMLARIHEEKDLQRRASIYRFPQQFHAMGPLLAEFLVQSFSTQVDGKPLMLRGVYFTSGTQEGNPIDRVLGALASTFKLERGSALVEGSTGKSFFVTRLLREVVFPEAQTGSVDDEPRAMQSPAPPPPPKTESVDFEL
jgi:type VI secretion system protein ImpL